MRSMKSIILGIVLCIPLTTIFERSISAQQGVSDLIQPNTVWKGQIEHGAEIFPTAIFIQQRNRDRVTGEIHFGWGQRLNKLTFQGNIVDGNIIVWITNKKEGNVTFPGLYIGKINGNRISGSWQVPSANQYDRFSVVLLP
jgi:hypothetical protein